MLTPSSPPSSPPLIAQDSTNNSRKRQRSQSMSSAPSSSPKRAASSEPLQDAGRPASGQTQDLSALSVEDSVETDIDAYMAEQAQGQDFPCTAPVSAASPAERLATVEELCNAPLRVGETWYVVSTPWFRRWRKACTGEVDKEGGVDEHDLGPVDNSTIVDPADDTIISTAATNDDYEFVPEQVWNWFVEQYGQPRLSFPRRVISVGVQEEAQLELHPPRVRVHVVVPTVVPGVVVPPRTITISVKDTINEVRKGVENALEAHDSRVYRIWKLADSSDEWTQASCTPEQLKARGGTLLGLNEQSTVEDELIQAGDSLAVESQLEGKWVVDASEVPAQPGTVSTSTSRSTNTESSTPKLFSSGSDFFSQMQSSGSKPAPAVKSDSSLMVVRSKGPAQEPGIVGLGNMGNTCFMNSALQCLAHTKELTDYFLSGVYEEELNFDNPLGMHGAIAQAFGALLQRIWADNPISSSYSPREFKQALQRFAPQFSGYQQHDSQELVAFLLDGLHEDLNRVHQKPYVEKPDWEGDGDLDLVKLARTSWEGYMKRNDSVIVDLFQGQYQSTLVCPECNKVSITFDPFMYLTLPLPVNKKWQHTVHFVPWDVTKAHVRVPVEINREASFKDLRQLLGRWMNVDPDYLLTIETFNHRIYKDLDDTCLVGEMADSDVIMCFELPCPARQSKTYKSQPEDPYIVPVFLSESGPPRTTFGGRGQNLFGEPFIVVVDHEQATNPDAMYDLVVDRLQQWTDHVRDLYTWEVSTPSSQLVQIPMPGLPVVESLTEIKEDGAVVELVPEESDIADEKTSVVQDHDDMIMTDEEPRKVGTKKDIFRLRLQGGTNVKYGASYSSTTQRFETWEQRASLANASPNAPSPLELLKEGDAFYCEFDENMKAYYFGDAHKGYEHARWARYEDFHHPELIASRKAAAAKKSKGISLQDCLDEFTREEKLSEEDLWYCPRCKKHQQATKRFDLWKVPDVLVVHLKRFSNSRTLRDKIDTLVDFPVEGLDISGMVGERKIARRLSKSGIDITQMGLGGLDEPLVYDLFAVDEHLGGLGGGHYRAYAYNHITEKWYHFDDSYVSPARPEAAVNANAYLLFYRRRTSKPLGGKSYALVETVQRKVAHSHSADATSGIPASMAPAVQQSLDGPSGDRGSFGSLPGLRQASEGWPTPQSVARSSPASSSPPPLEDSELPSFEESQFDDVLQSSLDPLAISAHSFDFPDPSARSSPTSSIEAEVDVEDLDMDLDRVDVSLDREGKLVTSLQSASLNYPASGMASMFLSSNSAAASLFIGPEGQQGNQDHHSMTRDSCNVTFSDLDIDSI
ncbi:cysteine proteinase [Wolfiporia cocos MD-104 SS10]|uniref:ubiquitinyl hydrolase 1 n=1 Tax=Wolfiporia cocos (strain MD-104) TaxID=742152 RepID=A0A2H3JQD0_WOLCO|nr:cysteine proteinase [Wolfiporia cocos MD-104 SS10]